MDLVNMKEDEFRAYMRHGIDIVAKCAEAEGKNLVLIVRGKSGVWNIIDMDGDDSEGMI